jgi:uncharacterized RmlC-like cupin family protein
MKPTCRVIRPSGTYQGKQGFNYFEGLARESVGSQAICMHLLTIPPGGRAKAHKHESHETAIYVISGEGGMWYGDRLEEYVVVHAGEFLYIPAGVPHLPTNRPTSRSRRSSHGPTRTSRKASCSCPSSMRWCRPEDCQWPVGACRAWPSGTARLTHVKVSLEKRG